MSNQGNWAPPPQGPSAQPYGQPTPYGQPAPYGQPGYGYGPPRSPEYEFDGAQNQIIQSAATWALMLGIGLFIQAVASLPNLVSAGFEAWTGVLFIGGSSALSLVVKTPGNDMANMMQALNQIARALRIRIVLTIITACFVLLILGLFVALGAAFLGATSS